ncbi:hypothetical protein [Legionella cherrii]|uniref:Substrate of the Dot/Icm secretion system n=1 Tax=Legionella cherrii TaxID=28084 RepID=A0A0W0SB73_9GAMM|nr:hypothetical protein [Legionella cherrii]KTC80308.1 hypothetical protein Lche_2328 [Legionella cherrii]VEB38889.1 Uncharacterised protein [Legionella cherrii]
MPNSREMLLKILNKTKNSLQNKVPPFQIECLDMFQKKIQAIQVDEISEMDLQVCDVLLDKCFCDLDDMVPREHRIIGLINKANLTNDDFYTKVAKIFDNEIKRINNLSRNGFYDQTVTHVKKIVIDMKTELTNIKNELNPQYHNMKTHHGFLC